MAVAHIPARHSDEVMDPAGRSIIDHPAMWRAEIIAEFRLRGDERCAAASPVPGFPQILDSMLGALQSSVGGVWLDLGGSLGRGLGSGLGGTASWIGRRLGQRVGLFDASMSNLIAARRLFAEIPTACATIDALPVRPESITVAIADGVVSSLVDSDAQLDTLLDEAARILADGGRLAVTDLWGPPHTEVAVAHRAVEDFTARADHHGFRVEHLAVADPSAGWWSSAAEQVVDEIHARHRSHHAYPAWLSSRKSVEAALAGDVIAAGLVLERHANGDGR